MHDVSITGLTRIKNPKPNQGGSTILAYFDCEVAGFSMNGCAFARTRKNGLVIWPPRIDGPDGVRRSIAITDDSIRRAIMLQAQATYRALGGTDAEWEPRDRPPAIDLPPIPPSLKRVGIPVTHRYEHSREVLEARRAREIEELDKALKDAAE